MRWNGDRIVDNEVDTFPMAGKLAEVRPIR